MGKRKKNSSLEFDFSPPPKNEIEKLEELILLLESIKAKGSKVNEEALEEYKRKLKKLRGNEIF